MEFFAEQNIHTHNGIVYFKNCELIQEIKHYFWNLNFLWVVMTRQIFMLDKIFIILNYFVCAFRP